MESNFTMIPKCFYEVVHLLRESSIKVYLVLCDMADNDTHQCYPGRDHIADRLGYNKETITDSVGQLISHGLISSKKNGYEGKSNLYTILSIRLVVPTPDLESGRLVVSTPTGHASPLHTRLGVSTPQKLDSLNYTVNYTKSLSPTQSTEVYGVDNIETTKSDQPMGDPIVAKVGLGASQHREFEYCAIHYKGYAGQQQYDHAVQWIYKDSNGTHQRSDYLKINGFGVFDVEAANDYAKALRNKGNNSVNSEMQLAS